MVTFSVAHPYAIRGELSSLACAGPGLRLRCHGTVALGWFLRYEENALLHLPHGGTLKNFLVHMGTLSSSTRLRNLATQKLTYPLDLMIRLIHPPRNLSLSQKILMLSVSMKAIYSNCV